MANFQYSDENRQSVPGSRNILERTSASISRSNQIAIETEQIGTEVLSELGQQRESLLRSQRRLEDVDDDLSKSRLILRAIRRNVIYNKLTLISIILLEVFILGGLLYIKLKK